MTFQKYINVRLALGAVAAFMALPAFLFGSCGADLSTQFHVALGRQYFSNGQVHQSVDITNLGSTRKGPIYFVIENMPAGVSESPFTYTANCEPPGSELIRVYLGYQNQILNGETKMLMLNFWNAQVPVNYTYKVIDGSALQNPRVVPGDYDGDGRADIATHNVVTGFWTIKQSSNSQVQTLAFGGNANTDHFVVGDFDGDLKEDLAFYRSTVGTWMIWRSSDSQVMSIGLGTPNVDVPVPADFDGDGYTDAAVYDPTAGVFKVLQSTTGNIVSKQFGLPGDKPVVADYDGDGKADFAVFRPSTNTFLILKSSTNQVYTLTVAGFKDGWPFAVDFDGDGRADMATYNFNTGVVQIAYFPAPGQGPTFKTVNLPAKEIPAAADYSGDHEADFATYSTANAEWTLDSNMNWKGKAPTTKFVLGNPPSDIPVMTLPVLLQ